MGNGGLLAPFMRDEVDPRIDKVLTALTEHAQQIETALDAIAYQTENDERLARRSDVGVGAGATLQVVMNGPPMGVVWRVSHIAIGCTGVIAAARNGSIFKGNLTADPAGVPVGVGALSATNRAVALQLGGEIDIDSDVTLEVPAADNGIGFYFALFGYVLKAGS